MPDQITNLLMHRYAPVIVGIAVFAIVPGLVLAGLVGLAVACIICVLQRAAAQAQTRADFLSHELNHRINNLFTVILSISSLAARETDNPQDALRQTQSRIRALSVAHGMAYGRAGQAGYDLGDLIRKILRPYSADDAISLNGPQMTLPVGTVTPLSLILHELATSASARGATGFTIEWTCDVDRFRLQWQDTAAAVQAEPDFGQRILQSSTAQLGGTLTQHAAIYVLDLPSDRVQ